MNRQDPLTGLQQRLAALQLEEEQLKNEMKVLGENIQRNATPLGIAKGVMSGAFKDKGSVGNTAKAALGLGAGLVASNLMAKQRTVALVGEVAALAVGFVVSKFAMRRKKRSNG